MLDFSKVKDSDPEIYEALNKEINRQQNKIELIASENFASEAVLNVMGSQLSNKYAEGYPGARYYGGCEYIDIIENLAISRLKLLFGAENANVQPHSGASANLAVFLATLNPGDCFLGMDLSSGGHLTHGSSVNISGKYFKAISYSVDSSGYIDYDEVRRLAKKYRPKLIISGASSYSRVIDFEIFKNIADEVSAYLLADISHIAGLIVANLHKSPFPYADFVTTTTHKTLRGPRGGVIMFKDEHKTLINKAVFPGCQGGPLEHVIAAKAVCFKEALKDEFKEYQKNVKNNSKVLSMSLIEKGIDIVSNGTDNHMMVLNLTKNNTTGKDIEEKLDEVGVSVNRNCVPNEKQRPMLASGIRIGTPAVTTRKMNENDMKEISLIIHLAITNFDNSKNKIKTMVKELCLKHPIYD